MNSAHRRRGLRTGAEAAGRSPETPHPGELLADSFAQFFEIEHDRLFGALYLITGNRHEAEDLMQEAFLRIWARWDFVQSLATPTGYLYRTAMNLFRMRRRHLLMAARRIRVLVMREDPFADADLRASMRDALAELSPRQRAALVLTDLLQYPADEAGEALGIRPSTVRTLSAQARAKLREKMGTNE